MENMKKSFLAFLMAMSVLGLATGCAEEGGEEEMEETGEMEEMEETEEMDEMEETEETTE
ncbi:hypothetical protein Q75_07790 [Bacillus coahuilensis p1.1.43]|uniref:Lipoprotein n=1 Tax=Bacillus coahuilensis p1.1.43 TaxID=1150625 RepID=A0A147K898_9BACI|nr:hypothetical protein [Bacillus coahuilensis]KUP06431.1 hypothetical protein Q75_07790 [Bacillus coahuilensis p1.1.43]